MFVYDTGRDLMAKGIIPAANILPEVAYVKLGWALGQSTDLGKVKDLMPAPHRRRDRRARALRGEVF